MIEATVEGEARTLLELGSGGGNNASHLKRRFTCTLTDISPEMLALSRTLNPECEHIEGDMRTLRLDRTFDAVLVHDAIAYITTEDDLRATLETVAVHLRRGGAALLVPDTTRELFVPGPVTAVTTATTVAACGTSNGRTIRIPATRPTTWSSSSCCWKPGRRLASSTTGTRAGSFPKLSGARSSKRPGSSSWIRASRTRDEGEHAVFAARKPA